MSNFSKLKARIKKNEGFKNHIYNDQLGNLTIGFGINADKWIIDGAVIAHEELGSSYRGSLGLKFGNKE